MKSRLLLNIRWWQIRKELTGIGLLYAFAVLLILFVTVLFLSKQYAIVPNAFVVAGCILLSIFSLHAGRKDKEFVLKHLKNPQRQMFTEYAVFSLPATLPVLFTSQWWLFIMMQGAFMLISSLSVTISETIRFRFLSRWIHPRDFEWLSGLRKSFPFMVFLYFAAWSLSWIMVAPLVCLWLITVNVSSFYIECESLFILRARYNNPKQLLWSKMKRSSSILLTLSLPVLILNSIFCPYMLWINAAFVIVQLILLHFAILLKYALYSPSVTLAGNNILLGIASLSGLIPFLLPLPMLMNIRNYGRALRNLENYYHD